MMHPSARSAMPVIRAYAHLLGVSAPKSATWRRFRSEKEDGTLIEHPGAGVGALGYDRGGKRVLYVGERLNVIEYLPHEITHCAWPADITSGPEEEWSSGMLCFEMAWLERLAVTPWARKWLERWKDYAMEGRAKDPAKAYDAERRAKRVVRKYKLPDPWATSRTTSCSPS